VNPAFGTVNNDVVDAIGHMDTTRKINSAARRPLRRKFRPPIRQSHIPTSTANSTIPGTPAVVPI
jgi:hypothetical protein